MSAAPGGGPDAAAVDTDWLLLFGAWLVATVSALGSLFFSEVMEFAPCILCWYQRICLFPLVLLLARGLFPFDRGVVRYAAPLAAAGWLLATYHNLLYTGVIPAQMTPCAQGVSCTEDHIQWLGFLSIPALAWIAFTALLGLLFLLHRRNHTA